MLHDSTGHDGSDHRRPNKFLNKIIEQLGDTWENDRAAISSAHPDLTPLDIKICILIKNEFKSWEIAQAFDSTERNIESKRSSIRKKMKLSKNDNLTTALLSGK